MVSPGVVAYLAAQEKVKLTAWQQDLSRIPHKSFLQSVQGELTTGVTCMEATYPCCTMSCRKAFRASLTAYDLTMEVVKDTHFKPYILAADNLPGCLFMTLPHLPPLPPHLYPPHPTSTPPSLLPPFLPSSYGTSPPALRLHPPPSVFILPSTFLPLPPSSLPCSSRPSPSYPPPVFPPHSDSPHFPFPSYHPPTISSLLDSLHSLLLRVRSSGSCQLLLDMDLQCVSVCMFLFSLPRPLRS